MSHVTTHLHLQKCLFCGVLLNTVEVSDLFVTGSTNVGRWLNKCWSQAQQMLVTGSTNVGHRLRFQGSLHIYIYSNAFFSGVLPITVDVDVNVKGPTV